jgi:glycerol-3-phosphate acyltransferase PlsX
VADEVVAALTPANRARLTTRYIDGVVAMDDAPARAARHDTTVRAAIEAVQRNQADAFVSAGASGATVTAAVLGLGRLPGVRRPVLAAIVPAAAGPVVLLDVGAGTDATATDLLAHAALGSAYAHAMLGRGEIRVGLLSIGAESGKGDSVRRAAEMAFRSAGVFGPGTVYAGLVEGNDVSLGTRADVVVTDGFTGNVLLKGIEGAFALAGGEMSRLVVPRAGALLGVAGTVVVCHGAAGGEDIASGIALAATLHRRAATQRQAAATATLDGVTA